MRTTSNTRHSNRLCQIRKQLLLSIIICTPLLSGCVTSYTPMGNEVKGAVNSSAYWRVRAQEVAEQLPSIAVSTKIGDIDALLGKPFHTALIGTDEARFYVSRFKTYPISLNFNTTPMLFRNGLLESKDWSSFWSYVWGERLTRVSIFISNAFPRMESIDDNTKLADIEMNFFDVIDLNTGKHTFVLASPNSPMDMFRLSSKERGTSIPHNNFINMPNREQIIGLKDKGFNPRGWTQLNTGEQIRVSCDLNAGSYTWHWIALPRADQKRNAYCNSGDLYYALFDNNGSLVPLEVLK